MKRFSTFFMLGLAAMNCFAQGPAETVKTQQAATKVTYLVIYRPGPGWVTGKPVTEQPLKEHGKYMLSLYMKGSMKLAGPLGDDGGAVLLEVADEAEAKAIVANDPAVKSKIFVSEMHPWKLQPWDKWAKKLEAAGQRSDPSENK